MRHTATGSLHQNQNAGNNDLETIRAASDIVRIIAEYVPLKKAGNQYWGLCPFHQERNPSFSVSPRKQLFKCWGCGVGGDVFRFIERIESVPFPQAKAIVAEHAGIVLSHRTLTPEQRGEYRERRILADESDSFWSALSKDYSDLAAAVYVLDQAACRWMLAHQDDPGVEESDEAKLCWLIFRLTPDADRLEADITTIRTALPEHRHAVYTSYRDRVSPATKQAWAQEREIEADITAYIVARIAFLEIDSCSGVAA